MSEKNYRKNRPQARPRYASDNRKHDGGNRNMIIGVLIGLIIGVSVVVGLAMYLNTSSTPFTNMDRFADRQGIASGNEPTTLAPGTQLLDASQVSPTPLPSLSDMNARADEADRESSAIRAQETSQQQPAMAEDDFDFYKILSGQKDAQLGDKASATKTVSPVETKPYLQVGVFRSEKEADNMKAKLALINVDASIQTIELPGTGLVHRVKTGPFTSDEEMQSVIAQLKLNGIDVIVRK